MNKKDHAKAQSCEGEGGGGEEGVKEEDRIKSNDQ